MHLFLFSLTICLSGIVSLVDNEVLRAVIVTAREVALENGLGASGISLLGVDRGSRHVGNHGVATAPWVLCVSERMVLGRGLREPHITTVAVELTGLEGLGDILLDNDCTASSVDEPSTCKLLG